MISDSWKNYLKWQEGQWKEEDVLIHYSKVLKITASNTLFLAGSHINEYDRFQRNTSVICRLSALFQVTCIQYGLKNWLSVISWNNLNWSPALSIHIKIRDSLVIIYTKNEAVIDVKLCPTAAQWLINCILYSPIKQVYLLMPIDRAILTPSKSPVPQCTPSEITRQQCCKQYLKHIATQTITYRLLAHTW